jgi:beta-RFAP synthase
MLTNIETNATQKTTSVAGYNVRRCFFGRRPASKARTHMIRVRAPSRLHFGLFSLDVPDGTPAAWPDRDGQPTLPARAFGGAGLMLEQPGVSVTVEPASEWSAAGSLAMRALAIAQKAGASVQLNCPLRVVVENSPPEHVGLGTGTQLGLAVARGVAVVADRGDLDATALAHAVDRGQRSGIGIHGFAHGGFLVEGGKRSPGATAPLVARLPFPSEWKVLLVIPRDVQGAHGERELAAFRDLGRCKPDLRRTDALCRLVVLGMLPALAERDLDAFGAALYDFNRRAGEMFQPWQGGIYAHPRIAHLVQLVRSTGRARGVGQSSWGPALFAVVAAAEAQGIADWLLERSDCRADELIVTGAANAGAIFASIGPGDLQ